MKFPPPDYSLIWTHQEKIDTWRNDNVKAIRRLLEQGLGVQPQCFIIGYDYKKKHYRSDNYLLDPSILDNNESKMQAWYWMKDLPKQLLFDALAFMFVSGGMVSEDNEHFEPVIYITFETRFIARYGLYRIIHNKVTDSRTMEYDGRLTRRPLLDDMQDFMGLFRLEQSFN